MLASIAVVVAALCLAKGVLVPLTLAVLLSFLLSPVCDWLERRRLGRIPAVLVTAFLGFAVLGVAAWAAVVQMTALALAETDWHRGDLDEGRHKFVLQSLKEMIHEKGDGQQVTQAKEGIEDGNSPRPYILCLPARDEADEIAGMMLAQLLATDECLVQSVSFMLPGSQKQVQPECNPGVLEGAHR
jgi:hypothetical protein